MTEALPQPPPPYPEPVADAFAVEDAKKLYHDFDISQIPHGTRFAFNGMSFPEGARCANSKSIKVEGRDAICTACFDKLTNTSGNALKLNAYELESAQDKLSIEFWKTRQVDFHFQAKTDKMTLKCSDIPKSATFAEFIDALGASGIDLKFKKPGDAKLLPRDHKSKAASESDATT